MSRRNTSRFLYFLFIMTYWKNPLPHNVFCHEEQKSAVASGRHNPNLFTIPLRLTGEPLGIRVPHFEKPWYTIISFSC